MEKQLNQQKEENKMMYGNINVGINLQRLGTRMSLAPEVNIDGCERFAEVLMLRLYCDDRDECDDRS